MYINGEKLKAKRFSSGEFKFLKSELDSHIKDNKVTILYNNEETIFELMLVIDYYKNYYSNKGINDKLYIKLILTYLPYQRMDHENRDELDTLTNVARIFNNLNLDKVVICEPHSTIKKFNNAKEFGFVEKLKQRVFNKIGFDQENDIIVLADRGGLKRYGNLSQNVVYFNKVRDIDTGLIIKHEISQKIDSTKKVIIVDDIISTGDTIMNIVDYLTKLGVKDIYILCGHYEKNRYNKRLLQNPNIKKIFTTNSLNKTKQKKLKIYDTKEIIYEN